MPEPIAEVWVRTRADGTRSVGLYHDNRGDWVKQERLHIATPEMVADAARLDWLEAQGTNFHVGAYNARGNYCGLGEFARRDWTVSSKSKDAKVREAIDAARAAGGAHDS